MAKETLDMIVRRVTGTPDGRGPCSNAFGMLAQEAWIQGNGNRLRADVFSSLQGILVNSGAKMEQETALLKAATDEARSSKETLEAAYNDLMALQLTVGAALEKIVGSTRAARMAVVGEMRESLQALKDVRQFFLESDYKTEMERLERFVVVCKELVALKKSGALDAVADVAIKLAVGETK